MWKFVWGWPFECTEVYGELSEFDPHAEGGEHMNNEGHI